MRNVCLRIHCLALVLVALAGIAIDASGQAVQTLIQFTNTWRYDQSGRDLSTTKWKTNDYVVDAPWQPDSRGLLGLEPDTPQLYTIHAPITTPLTISATVTSYYFRTSFPYSGTTNGVTLIATNLVDDGCVIFMNGVEVGRLRVAANQNAATFATGGTEGALEVINISAGLLRANNLMAVEVHQSGAASSDVMFGMKLLAFVPTVLVITNQPVGDTAAVGDTVTFTVGVSGGPAFYQWQKDGVNLANTASISGVNSNVLRIVNVQTSSAGSYRVVVSNTVTPAFPSSPAVLSVVEDGTGPSLVSAVIRLDTGRTNEIVLAFSENIQSSTNAFSPNFVAATNPANYRVTMCGTTNTVAVTNVIPSGFQALLRVSGTNWNVDGCYYLTVNLIQDTRGNNINPNSVIPVAKPITTNMTQMSDFWLFHASAALEDAFGDNAWTSNFTTLAWTRTNFVENLWWASGRGILYFDPDITAQLCAGDGLGDQLSFQQQPTLFRRTFQLSPTFGTSGTLRLRYIIDDGLILYLNGKEIHRYNMPGAVGSPYTVETLASSSINATCTTNVTVAVTNLFPGTNWLAAAVFQASLSGSSDTVFGLEMDGVFNKNGTAPLNTAIQPTIVRTRQGNNFVLSWPATNYGFALRYSTNIVFTGPNPDKNWGTNDAYWFQVKDQSNPYTNALPPNTGPRRFYRLHHPVPLN